MARPQFELLEEHDTGTGWTWIAQVLDAAGAISRHEIRLAWADYDLWCEGRSSPAAVAEAAYGYLLEHAADLAARDRVDLSWTRRVQAEADTVIPGLVR